MKIADVRTTVVAVPQKRAYRSSWRRSYQGSTPQIAVLVELETEDGLVGIGESPAVWAGRPEATVALIDGVRELLLRADPFEHDILRRRLYAETGMAHLGTQGLSWALSGVDTALWDLVGRALGQPLHRLWGGAWRAASPFYGDVPPGEPAEMAADAVTWVERGFRTCTSRSASEPTSTFPASAPSGTRWARGLASGSTRTRPGAPRPHARSSSASPSSVSSTSSSRHSQATWTSWQRYAE